MQRISAQGDVRTAQLHEKAWPTQSQIAPLKPITPDDLNELYFFNKPGITQKSRRGYMSGFGLNLSAQGGKSLRDYFIEEKLDEEYPLNEMVAFGRLDKDTSGALLLSKKNCYPAFMDQLLLNPFYKKENFNTSKRYRAKVNGEVDATKLAKIKSVQIPGSHDVLINSEVKSIQFISSMPAEFGRYHSIVEIEIYGGQYHQVKKMLRTLGHSVCKGGLQRIRFAMIELGDMQVGKIRKLFFAEKAQLVELYNAWLIGERARFQLNP